MKMKAQHTKLMGHRKISDNGKFRALNAYINKTGKISSRQPNFVI